MQGRWMMVVLVALFLGAGCSSQRVLVGPRPPVGFQTGTETVEGKACGFLLFGFIPISGNWTKRACDQAQGGRGKGLADTKIQYSWYMIPGGALLCTAVEGKVIQ